MQNTETKKVMAPLLAFHNDPTIKDKYVARAEWHQAMDHLQQGVYYQNNNGQIRACAVGCTLEERYDELGHRAYETDLGIPMILARLQDRIFEGLSVKDSKSFPADFLRAIPVGKDLSLVWKKFMVWLLNDPSDGVIQYAKNEKTRKAISDVADLLEKSLTEKITSEQFWQVSGAADAAAAYAAAAAAADAAAADAAAAAYAAAYAAAAYAAAADAAAAAYAAAAAAAAAAYAAAAARKNKYKVMADKLVALLAE